MYVNYIVAIGVVPEIKHLVTYTCLTILSNLATDVVLTFEDLFCMSIVL